MASQALDNDTSPVRRGLYVRQALLCQSVPDPPPYVPPPPPPAPNRITQMQRICAALA